MPGVSTAHIIDGKALAQQVREAVAAEVGALQRERGVTPGLAVVLLGDDAASQIYVRNKSAAVREAGMLSIEQRLPAATTAAALLRLIDELNKRGDVHGILVQLPLPAHIPARAVSEAIDPAKDVDGLHPLNLSLIHI